MPEKYSDVLADWLVEVGYTHCFFVAGGNIMHLLDSCRRRFACVATVHEVAAGIAVEYFNEAGGAGRAFALVTAGPGLTNIVTAMSGAFLESRELLVIGGQVKSSDLAGPELRQRGIQEIDGVAIAGPVSVAAQRIEAPTDRATIEALVGLGASARRGPVFLEVCLDAQGAPVDRATLEMTAMVEAPAAEPSRPVPKGDRRALLDMLAMAERPILLIGGGVSRPTARNLQHELRQLGAPVMTTWNGMDRIDARDPIFAGRPNTWGQRSANVLLQQADIVVALGTRLGLQQTGFNWQEFVPRGRVVQVDIDRTELEKGHPKVDLALEADANEVLSLIAKAPPLDVAAWSEFCAEVRALLPTAEQNEHAPGFLDPYVFVAALSEVCTAHDLVVPASSGGAFTVTMQAFAQRAGQVIITDKGLASMGYGLAGALGAAFAYPGRRTVLLEGDGGFVQNLQELGTVAVNQLPLKIFLFANEGYASIRMTQRNYFGGEYLGCDTRTGLGFPQWDGLFAAYGIPFHTLEAPDFEVDERFAELFAAPGPAAFLVPIDPEQTYFPKITSRVTEDGSMESNPLHRMSPELSKEIAVRVFRHVEIPR
jgi:acetolactate synthase I/II/III large subunit